MLHQFKKLRRNNGKVAKSIRKEYDIKNLCLMSVALNCVANGKILKEKIFDNIWIHCPGDAGGSLGAALALWYIEPKNKEYQILLMI